MLHAVLSRTGRFALLALLVSSALLAQTEYKPGEYDVDPAHSRVSFIIPHFVISEVEGRFNDVKGEILFADPFTDSRISATVPVKSIDTGVKKRDDHLRSKDFFEADKYPTMKFVTKSVSGTPMAFKLVAALTIKGVTRDTTFDGKYTGWVEDSWGQQRVAFQMTADVNRKDFNINYDDKVAIGPAVGEKVKIRIWTEGVKATESTEGQPKKK